MPKFLFPLFALLLVGRASPNKRSEESAAGLKPVSVQHGIASFYAGRWIGRKTANGEIYRRKDRTAAHRTLPFDTRVRVTDKVTGKSTIFRINNRGPYVKGISTGNASGLPAAAGDLRFFRLTLAQLVDSGACRSSEATKALGISKTNVDRTLRQYRAAGIESFFKRTAPTRNRGSGSCPRPARSASLSRSPPGSN